MDHQAGENAWTEFFAARRIAYERLIATLEAAEQVDPICKRKLDLVQRESAAVLRLRFRYVIEDYHWAMHGAGRKLVADMLAALSRAEEETPAA